MTTPRVTAIQHDGCSPHAPTVAVCHHGYWLDDCALCLKRPGECDFGSCTAPATTHADVRNARGVVVQRRPMCPNHAPSVATGLRATGIMPSVLVTLPPYPVKFR